MNLSESLKFLQEELGIKICKSTLQRRLRRKEITYARLANNNVKISEQALRNWVGRKTVVATAEKVATY